MPEFFDVLPSEQALRVRLDRLPPCLDRGIEEIPTAQALGRITAEAIHAPEPLPSFPRSTMDGFSLRAADTFGASEGTPAYFAVVGEVSMGQVAEVSVGVGEVALAYTGGMLARGADAVVMVENTQQVDAKTIEVTRPVAPGENVVQVGEDVKQQDLILPAGRLLRPQDLSNLPGACGLTTIGEGGSGTNPWMMSCSRNTRGF